MNYQDGEFMTMCKETILKALECKGLLKNENNNKTATEINKCQCKCEDCGNECHPY